MLILQLAFHDIENINTQIATTKVRRMCCNLLCLAVSSQRLLKNTISAKINSNGTK